MSTVQTPNGYAEIITTFGDVTKYVRPDGTLSQDWYHDQLATMDLPYALALSWEPTIKVTRITCHRLLVGTFHSVFQEIVNQGLQGEVTQFGGCYMWRPERHSHKISTHSWAIAIDLNPLQNQQGTVGTMDPKVVKIFTDAGFEWGGTFAGDRCDPMHFQFATGY